MYFIWPVLAPSLVQTLPISALVAPRKVRGKSNHNCISCHQATSDFLLLHLHGESVAIMPKDQQKHRVSRQRPVSCRFCRSRKLRCSREAPCSNCVSRGVRCELDDSDEQPSVNPTSSEAELLERIRKLEELVASQGSQQNERVKQHRKSSDTHARQTCRSTPSPQTERLDDDVAWLESIYSGEDLSVKTI